MGFCWSSRRKRDVPVVYGIGQVRMEGQIRAKGAQGASLAVEEKKMTKKKACIRQSGQYNAAALKITSPPLSQAPYPPSPPPPSHVVWIQNLYTTFRSHPPPLRVQDLILRQALLDDRWRLDNVLAEDVSLDEVRKPHLQLVPDKVLGRDGENLCGTGQRGDTFSKGSLTVQLFQGELLGLSYETEDHKPGHEIESGVETDWQHISP